eukprot:6110691-Karenia_brevis.AAC.1
MLEILKARSRLAQIEEDDITSSDESDDDEPIALESVSSESDTDCDTEPDASGGLEAVGNTIVIDDTDSDDMPVIVSESWVACGLHPYPRVGNT